MPLAKLKLKINVQKNHQKWNYAFEGAIKKVKYEKKKIPDLKYNKPKEDKIIQKTFIWWLVAKLCSIFHNHFL